MSISAEQIAELRQLLGHLVRLTDGRPWERQTTTNRLLEALPAPLDAAEEAERLRGDIKVLKAKWRAWQDIARKETSLAEAAESALTAANERVRVLEGALGTFEARTKALPEGHEDRTKGASSYNWRMACLREIQALTTPEGSE